MTTETKDDFDREFTIALYKNSPQLIQSLRKRDEWGSAGPMLKQLTTLDPFTHKSATFSIQEKESSQGFASEYRLFNWTPVAFSPSEAYLSAVKDERSSGYTHNDTDGTLYLWDTASKKLLWKNHQDNFSPGVLAFSPNSKRLAAGGPNYGGSDGFAIRGTLLVFNIATGNAQEFSEETGNDRVQQSWLSQKKAIDARLGCKTMRRGPIFAPGDSGEVKSLAWSPEGKKLAAGYTDGSIKIWAIQYSPGRRFNICALVSTRLNFHIHRSVFVSCIVGKSDFAFPTD